MKKYILIILLVFSVKFSSAQNYIPIPMDSATWFINWGCSHCANCYMDILTKTSGDTVINSVSYVKVIKHVVNGCCFGCSGCDYAFGTGYQGAIRQDTLGRKVTIILPNDSVEKILFDFTQNVGDTLNSVLSDICYPDIISSIDSILIGNIYHRRINTYPTGCNNPGTQFIEGIGSDKGLIESTRWFENGSNLICATHNGQTIYPDTITFCPTTVGLDEIYNQNEVTATPNPFTDFFEIKFSVSISKIKFTMYNVVGKKILELQDKQIEKLLIERNNLPSGIYFYQIIVENKIISTGKIIAE